MADDRTVSDRPRLLFVCTNNAGRSQMAQAMFAELAGDAAEVTSAGVDPWDALHPMAVKLMNEQGIDVSAQRPKHVASVAERGFDVVVTIGDPALRGTPRQVTGNPYRVHWDVSDPARADGTPDSESLFRQKVQSIRDRLPDLLTWITSLPRQRRPDREPAISTILWYPQCFEPATHLRQAADAGLRAVEICAFNTPVHFDLADADAVREARRVADDLGVSICALHAPNPHADLGAADPRERARASDLVRRCLDVAEKLAARVVVSHDMGGASAADESADARYADALEALTPQAEASPARIGFENLPPDYPGCSARDIARRIAEASPDAFGFVLDTGHAKLGSELGEDSPAWTDRLLSVHLHDSLGVHDDHLLPGRGVIDWTTVCNMLHATGYAGPLVYEIGPPQDDGQDHATALAETVQVHRQLFASAGSS